MKAYPEFRILVVDDNPAIHEDVQKILRPERTAPDLDLLEGELFGGGAKSPREELSFTIDSTLRGEEALEKVCVARREGRPYAVAVVDMRMPPGWNGLETLRRVWEQEPALQALICTAYSDHSWSDIVEAVGYRDNLLILKKPFDNLELCQAVAALSLKWHNERGLRVAPAAPKLQPDSRTFTE